MILYFPRGEAGKIMRKTRREENWKRGGERQKEGRGKGKRARRRGFLNTEGAQYWAAPCTSLSLSHPRSYTCDAALTTYPTSPTTFLPCSLLSSHEGSSLFLLHSKHIPTSGPLHLLFRLPGMLFPESHMAGALPPFSSLLKCLPLREAFHPHPTSHNMTSILHALTQLRFSSCLI